MPSVIFRACLKIEKMTFLLQKIVIFKEKNAVKPSFDEAF